MAPQGAEGSFLRNITEMSKAIKSSSILFCQAFNTMKPNGQPGGVIDFCDLLTLFYMFFILVISGGCAFFLGRLHGSIAVPIFGFLFGIFVLLGNSMLVVRPWLLLVGIVSLVISIVSLFLIIFFPVGFSGGGGGASNG